MGEDRVKKFFIFYIIGEDESEEVSVLFLFSAVTPHHTRHCEALKKPWQSQDGDNSRGVGYLTQHQMLSKIEFTN